MKKGKKRALAATLTLAMLIQQGTAVVWAAETTGSEEETAIVEEETGLNVPKSEPETEALEENPETEASENRADTETAAATQATEGESKTEESESETVAVTTAGESEIKEPESEAAAETQESESGTEATESTLETEESENKSEAGTSEDETVPETTESNPETESELENGILTDGNSVLEEAKLLTLDEDTGTDNEDEAETTSISCSVNWVDNNNQAGERPKSVRIRLIRHSELVWSNSSEEIDGVTLRTANGWKGTFDGLPLQDKAGNAYTYTISAETVAGYETTIDGYDVTYTYIDEMVETIDISGTISWCDEKDFYQRRPSRVMLYLMNGDKQCRSIPVTEKAGWKWQIAGLPKYDGEGNEISYSVSTMVSSDRDYLTEVDGYNITYTYIGSIWRNGFINWVDFENQQSTRPEHVTVLLKNGDEVCAQDEVEESQESWWYYFSGIPEYDKDGNSIPYTLSIEPVPGYTVEYDGNIITMVHENTKATTSVSGQIVWEDDNNQAGVRPSGVYAYLSTGSDTDYCAWMEVTEKDGWKWTFDGQPKYDVNGKEISYMTYIDRVLANYKVAVNNGTVTLIYSPDTTVTISGKLTWNDQEDAAGKRPETVKVKLLSKNKGYCYYVNITSEENWEWNFPRMPELDEKGRKITYELDVDLSENSGYIAVINGYDITLTYVGETETAVNGKINWEDDQNSAPKRPEEIQVYLLKDGEIYRKYRAGEKNGWSYSFGHLQKYGEDGREIKYTVFADDIPYYRKKTDENDITFTYLEDTVDINVRAVWNGIEKKLCSVLLLDSDKICGEFCGNLPYAFKGLPKYREDGSEIDYTIAVKDVPNGYTVEIDGYTISFSGEEPEIVDVSGCIIWEDDNNRMNSRPDSVLIKLQDVDSWQTIEQITVSETDNWSYEFKNLPRYENGYEIWYGVSAQLISDYQQTDNGYDIICTLDTEPQKYSIGITWEDASGSQRPDSVDMYAVNGTKRVAGAHLVMPEREEDSYYFGNALVLPKYENGKKLEYSLEWENPKGYTASWTKNSNGWSVRFCANSVLDGRIEWEDAENQDGKRPGNVFVKLLKGDEVISSRVISALDEWEWVFDTFPKYDEKKNEIPYTVQVSDVSGYEKRIEEGVVTFVHEPEKIEISGSVQWDDAENQDGKRPEGITVHLMKGEEELEEQTITEEDGWSWTFEELSRYEDGEEIAYTVEVEEIPEYTVSDTDSGVVYVHELEKVSVSGSAQWDDAENQDGKRPEDITVHLMKGEEELEEQTITEEDGWSWTFEELPRYEDGEEIVYTVEVEGIPEYTLSDTDSGVVYVHEPEKIEISGSAQWDDAEDQDGKRPENITVHLMNGEEELEEQTITEENGWSWIFEELPRYEDGEEIVYTIEVEEIPEYTVNVTKSGAVCVHEPEKTGISGEIAWDDGDNQDKKRPETVKIYLIKNGEKIAEIEVVKETGWTWVFSDIPRYENGKELQYEVAAENIQGYTLQINGSEISFSHTPETEETETERETKTPETEKTSSKTSQAAKTGDTSDIEGYFSLLLFSAFSVMLLIMYQRRKQH